MNKLQVILIFLCLISFNNKDHKIEEINLKKNIFTLLNEDIEKNKSVKHEKIMSINNEKTKTVIHEKIDYKSVPDQAEIHINTDTNEIQLPIFMRFRVDNLDWHTKNQSFNIYGQFKVNILYIGLFEQLKIFQGNDEIVNKRDILSQLIDQKLKINGMPPMNGQIIKQQEVIIFKESELLSNDIKSHEQLFDNEQELDLQKKNEAKKLNNVSTLEFENQNGQHTRSRLTIEDLAFEPDSLSDYPQTFSDIKINMELQKKEIVVKCESGKIYKLTFGQFLIETKDQFAVKMMDRQFNLGVNMTDNQKIFDNQLGQRYKIVNPDEINQFITVQKETSQDENQSIFPMLISMLAFIIVFNLGSAGSGHFVILQAYTTFTGIAMVSAGQRMQTNDITVSDQLRIASFQITIVQITQALINGIADKKLFDVKLMDKISKDFNYYGAIFQLAVWFSAYLQVIQYKFIFYQKKLIAEFKHQDLIEDQDLKQSRLNTIKSLNKKSRYSIQILFGKLLQVTANVLLIARYFLYPFGYIAGIQVSELLEWEFEEYKNYFTYQVSKKFKNAMHLSMFRQPVEYEQMKKLDINISKLFQIDKTWDQSYLKKSKLDKDAEKQRSDNHIRSQKDQFITLNNQIKEMKK